jgi:hypothetical protein
MINPINGLEMANQSGIASRKGSESPLRQCQRPCFFVFVLTLTRRTTDSCLGKRVRAIQQGAIRTIRTSDNHHSAQSTRDVRFATRHVSVAEVERKGGPHPSPSEECLFSLPETSAMIEAPPFRVRGILRYDFGGDF